MIFMSALVPVFYVVVVPSIWFAFRDGFLGVAFLNIFVSIILTVTTFSRRIAIRWKILGTIILFYMLALTLLLDIGIMGPGGVFMLFVSTLAAILISSRAGFMVFHLNFLVLIIHFLLVELGGLPAENLIAGKNITWWIVGLNILAINLTILFILRSLVSNLERSATDLKIEKTRLAEALRLQRAISDFSLQISRAGTIDQVYAVLTEFVLEQMDTTNLAVSLFDPDKRLIKAEYMWVDGQKMDASLFPPIPVEPHGKGYQTEVILSGEQRYYPDLLSRLTSSAHKYTVGGDGKVREFHDLADAPEDQPRSGVYSPMLFNNEVIGVLQVLNLKVDGFEAHEIDLLGSIANILGVSVSNHKLLADLQTTLEVAHRANVVKEMFMANMSHEIRTPLNSIIGLSQILNSKLEKHLSQEENELFGILSESGTRLQKTVHSILDISQIRAGTVSSRRSRIDLGDLIKQVSRDFEPQAKAKDLTYDFDNQLDASPIFADEFLLASTLSNLVENAVKFTDQGGIYLTLDEAEDRLRLRIRDTGIGMEPAYLEKIFEAFSQESEGRTKGYQGLGLGLSIAKSYADLNDIEVRVASQKDVGTEFTLLFIPGGKVD